MTIDEMFAVNAEGKALEREGRIHEAIAVYERGLAGGTDTPHTYRRLVVLYRRLKQASDEARVQAASKEMFGHFQ